MKNFHAFFIFCMTNHAKAKCLALFIFLSGVASAQLSFTKSKEANVLAETLVDRDRASIQILSADYVGSASAISHFTCKSKYAKFMKEGVILSTGTAQGAEGPNNNSATGYDHKRPGLEALNGIISSNNRTFDGAKLTLTFKAKTDSIFFNYVFASEEYPEFVNRNANDVFALILLNKQTGEKSNLAVLPNSKTPICVDEINAQKNSQFYVPNESWDENNILKFDQNREAGELAYFFQFDGFTTLLAAGSKIELGVEYELQIAIADVGDGIFDSAIFIEAGSFKSISQDPFQNALTSLFDDGLAKSPNGDLVASKNILFASNASETNDSASLVFLNQLIDVLQQNPNLEISVIGHTDSIGTVENNMKLSQARAQFVVNYLAKSGFPKNQLSFDGKGEDQPLDANNLALNRRVEFVFSKH